MANLIEELVKSIKTKNLYNYPNIYNVGSDAVAKENYRKGSYNEIKIGTYLFEKGIHVPEMHMLISPDFLKDSYEDMFKYINDDWFIIMQKIKGKLICNIKEEEKKKH